MGLQALRCLDAFPRADEHLVEKTKSGALVSIAGFAIMVTLFAHELRYYLATYTVHKMAVDSKRGETLPIHVNMTFPSLPCEVLSLNAIDLSGKHEVDLQTNIWKLRMNKEQMIIGHEYISDLVMKDHTARQHDNDPEKSSQKDKGHDTGSELEKIKKLKTSLENGEGCQVFGLLNVQKVAGNFHISVDGLGVPVAEQVFGGSNRVNMSHLIHNLAFGPEYPGIRNPLDGTSRFLQGSSGTTFNYYIKIVPTEYRYLSKRALPTNQFSVREYFVPWKDTDKTWPAVYFVYDLSPITVTIEEEHRSFLHFLTRLCAVLGGTFALTGMLDRWINRMLEISIKQKFRII